MLVCRAWRYGLIWIERIFKYPFTFSTLPSLFKQGANARRKINFSFSFTGFGFAYGIPSAEPQIRKVDDCLARFETIRNTFSSRIGQISNTAFDRSIIAYNENSTAEERERCRREVETLAILTGLEIDSAKSGIKPDLS